MNYTENDILTIAKRFNNKKRNYLLVNKLQGKHIPVNPHLTLNMMDFLGEKISNKYKNVNLIIGFAETATAIGVNVAKYFNNCFYINTTRENFENLENFEQYINFNEEHSHAVEQKLFIKNLSKYILEAQNIILVDDEFSTGKTLVNIIEKLKSFYPFLNNTNFIAVSIINRISNENIEKLKNLNIEFEYLIKIPDIDYYVNNIENKSPIDIISKNINDNNFNIIEIKEHILNTCFGVNINEYINNCNNISKHIFNLIKDKFKNDDKILVLGTEEFMYLPILVANEIEKSKLVNTVNFHSTTRSPISINNDYEEYPIKIGYKINSFYDENRETFIYNLETYNKVIIISDTNKNYKKALNQFSYILKKYNCNDLFFIKFN